MKSISSKRPLNRSLFKRGTAILLLNLLVIGCGDKAPYVEPGSDVYSNSDADSDADTDSDADADTDSDVDTDTDTDTDSDSDTDGDGDGDSDSDSDSVVPWVWVDNGAGEDCGPGCVQLTSEDRVNEMQWDIWGDVLTYSDFWCRIFVVNISSRKTAKLPDIYTEFRSTPDGTSDSRGLYPSIYNQTVFYSLGLDASPYRHELVRADLETSTQQVIWQREDPSNQYFVPEQLDVYGDILVTSGSTGDPRYRTLGYHEPPWSAEGKVLIDRTYGGLNSLWEDTLVFWAIDGVRENIRGYDFQAEKFFEVTDDNEYQILPRIHKRRVVYMDLRLGESTTSGTWEHGAVFMKDLDTGEVTQITDGAAIASYPDIHDDIIVWMDWRNCPNPNNKNDLSAIEIWGYNLVTKKTFQITELPDYQKGFPRIWGDNVFVHMFNGAKDHIFMFDLPVEAK